MADGKAINHNERPPHEFEHGHKVLRHSSKDDIDVSGLKITPGLRSLTANRPEAQLTNTKSHPSDTGTEEPVITMQS